MDKIRYGKWGCWIVPVGVLFSLLVLPVITAQQGFLSIKCGGETNHTDENNITWVSDTDYIDAGKTADIGNASVQARGSPLHSLRFFPKPINKSCYQLPVTPSVPFLLRLWFIIADYHGFQKLPISFAFSIETVDMLAVENIKLKDNNGLFREKILVTSDTMMCVCLIRTSESDDPFITGIELRPLRNGMYTQAKPGTMLDKRKRIDAGGKYPTVRYPQDNFDRIWTSNISVDNSNVNLLQSLSTDEHISTNNTKELPPAVVMQTAWVVNGFDGIDYNLESLPGSKSLLLLYFAEIETVNMSEYRSFYVAINGERQSENITLLRNYSAIELIFVPNQIDKFTLWKAANSTHRPMINAYEYYWLIDKKPATYSQDIHALDAIKRSFDIKNWISDPCYLIPWVGIGCDNSSSHIRISEIDLSGRNITGSVPNDIVKLTGLVRLYLQNNNLNGTVEWLSELKNLQELNIANNNFNGVIPVRLRNCSLKLNYSGNPHLSMDMRECSVHNSNNNRLKLILGITLSGILIIALALIVAILLYRKKFRKNKEGIATESRGVEMEPTVFLYQDYSLIQVPNSIKSRAFTLDEMVAATQTFSREIGRGGFGSVFFGELPEGKHIAVKVLSLTSSQGAQEFLNEVDLLSRINHRNLVSLLGYCNETREVMLIYEYMSGGSLRDHLYGLEYLHVGSTPKIIHRDVKTSNILLDSNMKGKLADFGLSRMTIDGENTHVTTVVKGTAGYLDPEYFNTQMLTEKSDVYSFGVVLLEIICGRAPIDLKLHVDELNIIRWVTPYLMDMDENGGQITEIIDKRLGGSYNMKSIIGVIKVAMRCVQSEPSFRPSMSEVVAELKEDIKHEDIVSTSTTNTGIEIVDLLAAPVSSLLDRSEPQAMEWSHNSSNISKVGR